MSQLPIQIPLLVEKMIVYYRKRMIHLEKVHKEYIRKLSIELQDIYEDMHEEQWGWYKIAYVDKNGVEVWTDDSREVYVAQEILNNIDRRRNKMQLELYKEQ